MRQKSKNSILKRLMLGAGVLVLVVLAAGGTFVFKHRVADAATPPPKHARIAPTATSKFSFTGTSGWWQGATNATSMALFRESGSCFTSAEYKSGTVDEAAAIQKSNNMLTGGGYTVTPGATQTLALQTSTGGQQYTLEQFSVASPTGADKLEGGQEFGYLQLTGGYIKIMGYCDTAAELPATTPALQAIYFDPAK